MYSQDIYLKTLDFAACAHKDQKYPGKPYSYLAHITSVCMEVIFCCQQEKNLDINQAICCALLHDVIEDTPVTKEEVEQIFGTAVAEGVLSLSKDKNLPKQEQLPDSLKRIKTQPPEVWAVKLSDRISNLQKPPYYWNAEKTAAYREEARLILNNLKEASPYLADRLADKIAEYKQYL